MTPSRWTEVRDALEAALKLPQQQRVGFLQRLETSDPELRTEVEALLACEADADWVLPENAPAFDIPEESREVGETVGPYRIVREAGRGGMGVVYEAERCDGQFTKRVAIKFLPPGFAASGLTGRFLNEREILAQLEHPGIARMLDGGITDAGEPYLVMEYVDGVPLNVYARQAALSVSGRLRLFLDVCGAVSYAHRRLIVHRDLKPANILVTREGAVKLLDFGLARMVEPGGTPEVTQIAFRLITPAYASPEQIRGKAFAVADDVFSLGVVLYELLAGKRPFGEQGGTPAEVERAVCEQDPAPIPRRDAAKDLNAIVLKALEKDPECRYPSVEMLAADLGNYLAGRPISARPVTLAYRATKFVLRNRWATMGATAAVVVVAATAVIAMVEARRAQRRFEDVRQLANSVMFEMHDEIALVPGSTRARELVVRRGLEYLDRLSRESGNDATLLRQLSSGYLRLGDAQGKPSGPSLGDSAGAAVSYRKAIAILDRLHARDPRDQGVTVDLVLALNRLCLVVSPAESTAVALRALQLSQAEVDARPDNAQAQRDLAASVFSVAQVHASARKYPESAAEFRKALVIYRGLDQRNHTNVSAQNVAACLKHLGAVTLMTNDFTTAIEAYRAARDIDEQLVTANPHSTTAKLDLSFDLSDLGTTLRRMNRLPEAEEVYRRAIDLRREAHQVDPGDSRARTALASILSREGGLLIEMDRIPDAIKLLEEGAGLWGKDSQRPEYGEVEYRLGEAFERLGSGREAFAHRQTARKVFEAARSRGALMPNHQSMYAKLIAR